MIDVSDNDSVTSPSTRVTAVGAVVQWYCVAH